MSVSSSRTEIYAGLALLLAAVLALVTVNGGLAVGYHAALESVIGTLSLHHWINDALMALFFCTVGIEIKRERLNGALRDMRHALLPVAGALGGIVVPMGVYLIICKGMAAEPEVLRGWAVPSATDIAFAVALVSVLKNWVHPSMRAFLLALAVLDDLVAIVVIALFYSSGVVVLNLMAAAALVLLLVGMNRLGVMRLWPYLLAGAALWFVVLKSGLHATLAGVVLGLCLPQSGPKGTNPGDVVEHALMPYVRWTILPLFAFANMGLDVRGLGLHHLLAPVTLGIALGLVAGKTLGVTLAVGLAEKFHIAHRPAGVGWGQIVGIAALCGIGFTMSLFIGNLAFAGIPEYQNEVRLGVLLGSSCSAMLGAFVLYASAKIKGW